MKGISRKRGSGRVVTIAWLLSLLKNSVLRRSEGIEKGRRGSGRIGRERKNGGRAEEWAESGRIGGSGSLQRPESSPSIQCGFSHGPFPCDGRVALSGL